MASILVSRHLKTTEDLHDSRPKSEDGIAGRLGRAVGGADPEKDRIGKPLQLFQGRVRFCDEWFWCCGLSRMGSSSACRAACEMLSCLRNVRSLAIALMTSARFAGAIPYLILPRVFWRKASQEWRDPDCPRRSRALFSPSRVALSQTAPTPEEAKRRHSRLPSSPSPAAIARRLRVFGWSGQQRGDECLQPAADTSLVTRILLLEVALEEPFLPWDHNHRDDADSGNECYEQPKIIQPK